ncbi:MAG: class I SAM-dependent methyltransferase [Actinomycetota bacterium]
MDAEAWNDRYGQQPLLWKPVANRLFTSLVDELPAGRALDLGAGEGGNAVWLAEQGWRVTAVDFSSEALKRMSGLARERGVKIETVEADVLAFQPTLEAFDLVALLYLQLPAAELHRVLDLSVDALAPGGTLIVIAHDVRNLEEGVGGPQDANVLLDTVAVTDQVTERLEVIRAETLTRSVEGQDRAALDALVVATKPQVSSA